MNTLTRPASLTRWLSTASALVSVPLPATSMLAHDPLSATAEVPGEIDVTGLTACWPGSDARPIEAGMLRHGRVWIMARRLTAGPGYATADIWGLRYGDLYVRSLTVCCVSGLAVVQIDASADGEPLSPGQRRIIGDFEIHVGAGRQDPRTGSSVTGLAIAAPGEPVLRVATARADTHPAPAPTGREGQVRR